MIKQPSPYPYFTRYGEISYKAYISDSVLLEVNKPDDTWNKASIDWTRERYTCENPRFAVSGEREHDVLITRDEFMAAYKAADEFLQAAAQEFLPAKAIDYATKEQKDEITRLLSHPAFDKRVKSRMLLKTPGMTFNAARVAIVALTDTRTVFDQVDYTSEYKVIGEAWMQAPAA